jgi:FixJ family two-component response regulator
MSVPPTITIIDDDAWARQGIDVLVASLGYRTLTFASAEEFLESGHVEETACVVTDMQMPGLSGFDLQRRLKDWANGPHVIVVTAYPDEKSRARALGAGAFGFLTKPFDEKCLIQCLADAVGSPDKA